PWDVDKVYAYYAKWANWNKALVDRNVLKRYAPRNVDATVRHDPLSIMQYPVDKRLTTTGYEIGWNNELSDMDKAFIAKMYPPD
ncbi:MAG: Tolloid-like protein 1, partial [Myxococcota bacterium]